MDGSAELTPDLVDAGPPVAAAPTNVGLALERASAVFVALLTALVVAAAAVHEARASGIPAPPAAERSE